MKKYLWLLVATLGLALSSCGKNDNSDQLQVDRIAGTWEFTSVSIKGNEVSTRPLGISLQITFTASGTWTGTGSASGMDIPSGSGTYTITNTTLRLKDGGTTYKWDVKSLTETEFVFYWSKIGGNAKFERI